MSDVTPKYKGSVLRPLKALSFLFKAPETLPMEPRPASERYRGFHVNDWEKCIGCGTCQQICDNEAIRMVHIAELPTDAKAGVKPRRPAIDYGRCCWCALCVDICPTGSLALSREYIHVSADLDTYLILPDAMGMHGAGFPVGWGKSEVSDLLDLERQPMRELGADRRGDNFDEIVAGYDDQTALLEASRCIQCGMCHEACPAHMHAPEYIRALFEGDAERAVAEIYRTNPFPQVCGRICTRKCEDACSVARRGDAIAIRWLKRFALDNVDHQRVREIALAGASKSLSGQRIAIIGAGPAGLTAAFDLAKRGHKVTVYEAKAAPGGMMRYGIPEYRLPYDRLDADIDVIRAAGVDIRCNARIGGDMPLSRLRDAHDAVLVTTGLGVGRSTRIEGSDHPRVVSAIDLLDRITSWSLEEIPLRAVVIGGGNVAFDIARSLARVQNHRAARSADVTVVALEAWNAMLADEEEVMESGEEGIELFNGRGPKRVVIENGELIGLETVKCLSIFDEQRRFHPKYDDNDVRLHPADIVVEAIGQSSDLAFLGQELTEALEWQRGRLKVDHDGRTSEPWLWAAGDLVEGPDVIHAIAGGHRAAASIDTFLLGEQRKEAAE